MEINVIIPTAGLGNRMGALTKNLNKALLPYKEKPIISHIIDNFPKDSNFFIPLGYLSNQVKDYLTVSYPDRKITFIDVDDFTSDKSGTAYTLKCCESYIHGPFWYVPCDTYFNEDVINKIENNNLYFVKAVPENTSHLYTMLKIEHNLISDLTFKTTTTSDYCAFTGLTYIHDWLSFFKKLKDLKSNEFIYLIEKYSKTELLNSWVDFGDQISYQTALSKSQKFDFSKKDEITYICNNKTVKWWLNEKISKQKIERFNQNSKVYPDNCVRKGNFISYDFFHGKTLYQFNNPIAFNELLNWLDSELWHESNENIDNLCLQFYKDKTLNRISMFREKYSHLENIKFVDNVKISNYSDILENIDWNFLSNVNRPGYIHGDLQFDNIIINNSGDFKLIDWRNEFSGSTSVGDIYYDLAKMAGGLIINYSNIKNHNFNIEYDNDNVLLSIPNIDNLDIYDKKLYNFINSKKYNYKKVRQLIPIIFWNMSPLHTAPFDQFLWFLGLKLFAENEKIL